MRSLVTCGGTQLPWKVVGEEKYQRALLQEAKLPTGPQRLTPQGSRVSASTGGRPTSSPCLVSTRRPRGRECGHLLLPVRGRAAGGKLAPAALEPECVGAVFQRAGWNRGGLCGQGLGSVRPPFSQPFVVGEGEGTGFLKRFLSGPVGGSPWRCLQWPGQDLWEAIRGVSHRARPRPSFLPFFFSFFKFFSVNFFLLD